MRQIIVCSLLAFAPLLQGASPVILTAPVVEGLRDPIEIAVSPSGDIFVIEREGRVLRVRPQTGGVFEIGKLDVAALHATNPDSTVSREDGMLGIALDPAFENNQRLFIYYSDAVKSLNRLSRFTLRDGLLDRSSEFTLLEIPTQRENKVCHSGGSLAFGPDGLLYISTGDNTNPFESSGFAPLDDRPGREHYDSQRTAGNTSDLRGKILRIKPTEKGYDIPPGNLFKPGTPKTRPEIFIMGCRNPYRISLDPKTRTLYWGEVGPDAQGDGPRGPTGHDEINQAKQAGNYGWPFVVADNQPYPLVDFATGKPGRMTDPAKPLNTGSRNTGLTELPPAQPAVIWYPYGPSKRFPAVGVGPRNAMAGPVFYYDASRKWNLLGREADATFILYDWARGKVLKAKLDPQEKLGSLDLLVERLNHPMDMAMAPDGTLWVLEYGTNWYFNKDGRIRGLRPADDNRAPEVTIEAVPNQPRTFAIKTLKDPDGDPVFFRWFSKDGADEKNLGNTKTVTVTSASATDLRAVAMDAKGGITVARVALGQEHAEPALTLSLPAKPDALDFGQSLAFKVSAPGNLDPKGVSVRARYIPPTGHDAGGPEFPAEVREVITAKSCIACHQVEQSSVGPRFLDVALRFQSREDAMPYLRERLKNGSSGDWGEVPMPPQAAVNDEEAAKILKAILGLAQGVTAQRGQVEGQLKLPPAPPNAAPGGAWEILAEAPGFLPARVRVAAK